MAGGVPAGRVLPASGSSPDEASDLRALVASRHSLVLAEADDEERLLDLLRRAALSLAAPLWTWTATRGLARDGMAGQPGTLEPRGALAFVAQIPDPGVFVLLDAGSIVDDPVALRMAKEYGQDAAYGQTLVVTGLSDVPSDLRGVAVPWRMRRPRGDELVALVHRTLGRVQAAGIPVVLPAAAVPELAEAIAGLTLPEADRVILKEAALDGRLDASDLPRIRAAKAELLAADSPLELVEADADLDSAGGLAALKAWLAERRRGFEPAARSFGLEPPRGVLLVGVPGCGKSLVAKGVARSWGFPLALLDVGRIYGAYVGESEKRLRSALDAVEVMAPVVLWIDEIEKGFGSSAGSQDGGVSQRVLGTFLHWLQERPDGVFVIATANDVTALPPELLRRGRFDEIFFVDLPTVQERAVIAWTLLARRGHDPATLDVGALAAATDGFSGAEIENVIVGALYAAYAAGGTLGRDQLLAEAAGTVPLSRTRSESVAALRAWAHGRAVPAS